MERIVIDVVVIGAGPAGQKAAIQSAKLGKKVVVIDSNPSPGGACLYSGTIPSKTFREAVVNLTSYYERSFATQAFDPSKISLSDLFFRLRKVMKDEKQVIFRQLKKNGIDVIQGFAEFENAHDLLVHDFYEIPIARITAQHIFIATGSKPRNPPGVPFDLEVILDSSSLLAIDYVPKSMIVLGGGIIGSEYASFFAALGTEVTVIDRRQQMLPLLDSEIGVQLQTALMNIGVRFKGNKEPEEISRVNDKAYVKFKDGTSLTADVLLYALGRTSNTDCLHVEKAGISLDQKGYLGVNPLFQTTIPHIYAVGDVIGGPCLASTSMEQGRLAALHAAGAQTHYFPSFYPVGIYTIPEISSFGFTEDELKDKGYHYEVGRAYYYEIARNHIAGGQAGMFKILFHAETREVLGVHVIGRDATEVIHIGQVAMSFGAKIDFFIDQVFNYPTFTEGYRIAALNGLNKIKSGRYNR